MKLWNRIFYTRIIALFLTVSLLAGCVTRPGSPTETSDDTTKEQQTEETSQDYEVFTEEHLLSQKTFDDLTEKIFMDNVSESLLNLHYTLADPAAYGITDYPITFGDFSLDILKEDLKQNKELLSQLEEIDPLHLTSEQKVTYDILHTYLETEMDFEGLELYYQPFSPTVGLQAQLPVLLAEYTFRSRQDVEDYLGLLSQIDEYYAQIMEFEKEKSDAGLFMCDKVLDEVLDSCEGYLLPPEQSFLTETFATRLNEVSGLTEEEKNDYIARNEQVLREHFIPAYQLVSDGLDALRGTGINEEGLWRFTDGSRYYEYLVKSSTGTSYSSIDSLRKAIETQMDTDIIAISRLAQKNPGLMDQYDDYSFQLTDPNEILEDLQKQITADFPELPKCTYQIKYVPEALETSLSPAFYLTPPMDQFENNVIYINGNEKYENSDLYTVLAHEGYPGHLYQTVYFTSKNTCNLRQLLSFSSYSEGWATYVEHYAYTLDNGLDHDFAQLLAHNSSAMLGLHALLDININYYGWNKEQVAEYLNDYYGITDTETIDNLFYAMVSNPTNYLEYYVGYLEIIHLKGIAEKTLKKQFDLKEFHTFLLDIGPAPFSVINKHFKNWILSFDT